MAQLCLVLITPAVRLQISSPAEVGKLASKMLGYKLKTKQTGADGVLVRKVLRRRAEGKELQGKALSQRKEKN